MSAKIVIHFVRAAVVCQCGASREEALSSRNADIDLESIDGDLLIEAGWPDGLCPECAAKHAAEVAADAEIRRGKEEA